MTESVRWPPGWFPDPTGQHDHRWWDGAAWTEHVADAGVAGRAPLTPSAPPSGPPAARPGADRAARPTSSDPVAGIALGVAILALPVALLPGLGLIVPIAAVALAFIARSRVRASGRGGDGAALAALVIGIVALVLALLITGFSALLLAGSGGELAGAFGEYVACLEVRSQAECRVLLDEALARIVG
jgi:hypothetical protein